MKTKIIVGVIFAVSVASATAAYVAWHFSPDQRLERACRTLISERLIAPSTAHFREGQIWHGQSAVRAHVLLGQAQALMADPGYDMKKATALLDAITKAKHDDLGEVVIQYDAENRMGVPLRSSAICTFPVSQGNGSAELAGLSYAFDF